MLTMVYFQSMYEIFTENQNEQILHNKIYKRLFKKSFSI